MYTILLSKKGINMIDIYTDGSSLDQTKKQGDRRGGAAIVVTSLGVATHTKAETHMNPSVTNNTMEMRAMIMALRYCNDCNVDFATIHSDSKYVVDGINDWMPAWKSNGWTKSRGEIANLDSWKEIDNELEKARVSVVWVKAHNGDEFNEMADRLAYEHANS